MWREARKGEEHPTEPPAPWTSAEENTTSLGNINTLTKDVFSFPRETFVHALSSYGHVYSFSSEGRTK